MRMLVALVRRSLRRHLGLIAGLATVLSGFQLLLVVIARNFQIEGLFTQLAALMPGFVQEALGGAVIASYGGTVALGFFHPVVMLALSCFGIYLASEPAGEVEDGLVDLVVARPVPRYLIVTRSAIVAGGSTAAVIVLMVVANRTAVAWLTPTGVAAPRTAPLLWVALNLAAVTWSLAAAALVLAAHARRRTTAAGALGLTAVCCYLLQFAAASWAPIRPFARVSPFHYHEGMRTLLGLDNPRPDILILVSAAAALLVWAYVTYAKRDL